MSDIYGHKWSSSYGDTPSESWILGMEGITAQEIAVGLNSCLTNGDAWPPSLPEFRALCRPSKENRINSAMYEAKPTALPEPDESKEKRKRIGLEQIAKIKAGL